MTKKVKKGFTLLELIVVMAIFSILMVGVMSLITPVSNMFKSAAISEKTYSYANNVQQYLQTKLEYAEDVCIGSETKMGLTEDGAANDEKLAEYVEEFRIKHFKNVVKTEDGGDHIDYVNGKIHVVRLVNKDGKLNNGDDVKKGQITHRIYDFNSEESQTIKADTPVDEIAELNPAFLDASDAAYDFSYALGASNLVAKKNSALNPIVTDDLDSKMDYKVLSDDFENTQSIVSSTKLSLNIVLNKKSNGFVECKGEKDGTEYTYRAFATPCSLQIVNLPLTNIAYRSNHTDGSGYGLKRPINSDSGVRLQQDGETWHAFGTTNLDNSIDFDEDIYFIYCFTDEIES